MKDKKVAIVGAGLTGLTTAYYLVKAGLEVKIFEKSDHVGGVIKTEEKNGFVFERGPNSGVISNVEIVKLFEELHEDCKLEYADKSAEKRLIWKKDKWEAIPSGLFSAIRTPLFTLSDKLRVLAEPLRKKGTDPNENLADLVKRRLGKSFLNYAVDPFVSGIYAGDPEYLIPKYALPKLYNLEQNYGSFIKGAMKKRKEPKTEDEKKVSREIFSFEGGLKMLIKALIKNIGPDKIELNCQDLTFDQVDGYFMYNNEKFTDVVSTVNSENLKNIFPFVNGEELIDIENLQYAKVVEVTLGFKEWKGLDLNAFGGLVPMVENKNILGVLYLSTLFSGRAPKGGALLTIFVGGTRKEELTKLNEAELKTLISDEIADMMGLEHFNPDLFELTYYNRAIAQYGKDSEKRIAAVNHIQDNYKGLIIGGSIVGGVGIADRVKQASDTAKFLSQ